MRTIDIAPTVYSLLGVEGEGDGIDLSTTANGNAETMPVYAEAMLYGHTERSLQSNGLKLIHDMKDNSYKLYNTVEDPMDKTDIAASHPDEVSVLKTQLEALHSLLEAGCENCGTGGDHADQSDENLEALRALGYLE